MNVGSVSAAVHAPVKIDKSSDLYKACEDFESILIKQMLDVMRKTVPKDGLLDGGIGQDLYQDMLYEKYADQMTKTSQFGIARMIYEQVSRPA
jgi:peptidoglycan hydrolase FlgJ